MKTLLFISLSFFSIKANAQTIDARASSIADSVIVMIGGKQNWDNTRYLHWNYFGRRILWWDKWNGNVRIEIPAKKLVLLSNINTKTGKAFRNGVEITQADSVAYFNDRAYKILINDSYWLAMPFKLKDPGVNLTYMGTVKDSSNNDCFLLKLTFNNVGVTPQNMYHVWVNKKNYMITQWAYYEKSSDDTASIINPWNTFQKYGNIMLSGDRGKSMGQITDISVNEIPMEVFTKP